MIQLQLGLVLYGMSDGMILMSGLGANPWDVFHQGLAKHIGLQVGTTVILVGVAVMLFWIPIRQKPGFGTLSNVVVVGLAMDGAMAWMPSPHAWWLRWGEMFAGIVLNGVATGAYIGAGMGPGPRDGVMTGYAARGHSIRVVRTSMEITVLASGWLLGGTVGIGTAAYALLIGPLAHRFIPLLAIKPKDGVAERSARTEKRRWPSGRRPAGIRELLNKHRPAERTQNRRTRTELLNKHRPAERTQDCCVIRLRSAFSLVGPWKARSGLSRSGPLRTPAPCSA